MEGHGTELEGQAGDHEHRAQGQHFAVHAAGGDDLEDFAQIERTRGAIEHGHAIQQEAAGQGAEHEILDGRLSGDAVVAPQCGERVQRQAHQFQAEVDDEKVVGRTHHRDAEHREQGEREVLALEHLPRRQIRLRIGHGDERGQGRKAGQQVAHGIGHQQVLHGVLRLAFIEGAQMQPGHGGQGGLGEPEGETAAVIRDPQVNQGDDAGHHQQQQFRVDDRPVHRVHGRHFNSTLKPQLVLADGRLWRGLGGLRKDNTGYDLRNLFIGGEGTLGIITAATLKLSPQPAALCTALVSCETLQACVQLLGLAQRTLGATLTAFEAMNAFSLSLTRFSWNCSAAVETSNPLMSGMVTTNDASAPSKATQRAVPAVRSLPNARSKQPTAIGSQIATLKRPMNAVFSAVFFSVASAAQAQGRPHIGPQAPGQQGEHAQRHDQRIPVQQAGLKTPHHAGQGAHAPGRTVDEHTVNQPLIATLPQAGTQGPGEGRQDVLVDPVHVVLVFQQRVDGAAARLDGRWNFRFDDVEHIGQHHTGQRQPQRQRAQGVQGHGTGAVKELADFSHGGVARGIDKDRILEETAMQHRADGEVADDHRGNGQQHQRQPDHGGRFMGRGIVMPLAVSIMVVMMVMLAREGLVVETLLAVEDQEVHAEGIESGDEHARHHREVGKARARQGAEVHRFDDAVLRVKAREQRRADQRQRTQQRGDPGDGHVLAQAAHVADVLVMVHADDHRARRQEQQRLEERVRHEVEHRHRMCTIRDTKVTTHIIMAERLSIWKPTSIFSLPTVIHSYSVALNLAPAMTSLSTITEPMKDTSTPRMVTQCAPARPT
ncbi:hypothetical protein B566_EDAN018342 [Ephemera danica]|nr:hypothetical protein B566_EDAN018342 [Ephemera danica]